MLYIVGLGLNELGYSREAYDAVQDSEIVYLESYTVEFPYSKEELEKQLEKKIKPVDREFVESLKWIDEAQVKNVALLVYGNPLMATTHIGIVEEAKKRDIEFKIIHGASVLDAVSECGLQIYKFGKITSLPEWKTNYEPTSFLEVVKSNQENGAHSLILVDIGLKFKDALEQLEIVSRDFNVKANKIIVASKLGTNDQKIVYGSFKELKKQEIKAPFCFIVPGKLHFIEEEFLEKIIKTQG